MTDPCKGCKNMKCPIVKGDSIPWQHPSTCNQRVGRAKQ